MIRSRLNYQNSIMKTLSKTMSDMQSRTFRSNKASGQIFSRLLLVEVYDHNVEKELSINKKSNIVG